ncbi:MAG: hypothetical protein H6832_10955 [Planctomycetes bacterium]|nr:hypothetical protein [Planctomycetota bacterium]MCB9891141.1 hypothetical protein [Planctomycetota bacterium]MCB9918908.1 hypothetical protein [Planctomycetota bacterium]
MLLVLAPLPHLDRVQFVERLDRAATVHDVQAAHFEAGGAGFVALRAARALGLRARLVAFRGPGSLGDLVASACDAESIDVAWLSMAAPTPMRAIYHGLDASGAMTRRVYREHPPRLADTELRAFLARCDRELQYDAEAGHELGAAPSIDGVLVCETRAMQGSLAIVFEALVGRVRDRGLPWMLVTSLPTSALRALGPTMVFEDRKLGDERDIPDRVDAHAANTALLLRDAYDDFHVELPHVELDLDVPKPGDRGGEAPLEAAAIAYHLRRTQGWPERMASCFAAAAAVAQTRKQLGGRLAMSEIEGFFSQVRAREIA